MTLDTRPPPLENESFSPQAPDPSQGAELIELQTRDEATGFAVPYYEEVSLTTPPQEDWLALARDSYESSTQWLQSDMYGQWERNIANFRSLHPPGSKYHTNAYKYRSKMFRPKTRTMARKLEEAMVAALFSNKDLVSIEAQNMADPTSQASAEINFQLVQERLTNGSIPWYETVVGATQDATVYSRVVSCQYWEYKEQNGQILLDRPRIDLVPPENLRIDRAANWADPINDSPYLIHLMPMYIGDVMDRMKNPDPKTGKTEWIEVTADELRSASKEDFDGLRAQRNKPQTDPLGSNRDPATTDFDTVWVHRNIIRKDGDDWIYYTAGTTHLLSEPVKLQEEYPWLNHGERNYKMGTAAVEAHKVYPDSPVQLGQNLQSIANDIANRRHDNVLLAMDKRFIIRRDANIDRDQLFRTVPGGGIETDDPNTDFKIVETGDVTGSAYAEQDRVNLDYDDLLGQFNQGTNQRGAGRDSVGGMNMTMSNAGGSTDYVVRTLLTTWVQPVLDQLVRMEQYYESDPVLLAVAGEKAQLYQKFGINEITDNLLRQSLTVNINVGIGATDPQRRIETLMGATNTLVQMPGLVERLNVDEFIKEIYSAAGYQDGSRFINPQEGPSPQEQELMAQVEEMQRKLEGKVVEGQMRLDMERVRQQGQVEEARIRGEYTLGLESLKQRIKDMEVLIAAEKNDIAKGELEMERDALQYQMLAQELNIQLESEREARQASRDYMKQGDTGQRTPAPARPSPRVLDSGAGTITRDRYGNVPFAEG